MNRLFNQTYKFLLYSASALAVALTGACTSAVTPSDLQATDNTVESIQTTTMPSLPDLSGHWEKNYGRSDDFNNRFNLFIADVQRGVVRNSVQGPAVNSGYSSREALLGLARFAEEITRLAQLDIEQQQTQIEILRPDDFPLVCPDENGAVFSNVFGSETCAWRRNQLVFRQVIGRDLTITHQLTLGPDGNELNLVTIVDSAVVSVPLTISNFYRRADTTGNEYDCMLTLTRNTVCSRYGQ